MGQGKAVLDFGVIVPFSLPFKVE